MSLLSHSVSSRLPACPVFRCERRERERERKLQYACMQAVNGWGQGHVIVTKGRYKGEGGKVLLAHQSHCRSQQQKQAGGHTRCSPLLLSPVAGRHGIGLSLSVQACDREGNSHQQAGHEKGGRHKAK